MSKAHRPRRTTARRALLALCAALSLWSWPLLAQHPNQPQGFSPERSYQQGLGGIDQVDLYSGRLSLTIPVGPFTLYYNNNVWRYEEVIENKESRIQAIPDRQTTAGLGWHLGWGELYHPDHWYNPTEEGQWMYVGQDGQRHFFYDRMHYNDAPDGDANVEFTRDNSYLRLRRVSTWVYDIELPDGSTRRFANEGSLSSKPFRLVSSWSSFGSATDPDLTITYNVDDTLRTLTDRYGRNHYVHLLKDTDLIDGFPVSWMTRVVSQIDSEGFGGQRNIYDLVYRNILVSVSCKDTASATPARIRIPHLTEIQNRAEGTAYTLLDGATPAYYNLCEPGLDDVPGALQRINLPTGGSLRWTFQRFEFPPGDNTSVFNTAAGVASREMVEANGTVAGSWTYRTRNVGGSTKGGEGDPEMRLDVVALPEGDCTRHYFDSIYYQLPSQQKGWELGLPFTYTLSSGGKYLSTEAFSSNDGSGLCAGTKLRSTYVRYRKDVTPGCVYDPNVSPTCPRPIAFYDSNRTVEATRVVYHDDGDRFVDTELSDFDGLGNFREAATTGSFWAPSLTQERRHSRTEFNRVSGTYGQAGYAPPTNSTPWLLGLFASTEETEDDAVGETTSRTEVTMNPSTGVVECARQLRSGTSRSTTDLLTTYTYNSLGLVSDVKFYGSDLQSLPLSGSGCGSLPFGNPLYWTTHLYQYGSLKTTYPRLPGGGVGAFPTYDVDLDPSTGLVTATRDSAGYEVAVTYDSLGRITDVTPQDGAYTTHVYTNALGTSPAKVTTTMRSSLSLLGFGISEIVSDSFGRRVKERVLELGNEWRERDTVLNARGWLKSISEWGSSSLKTEFLELDAFGRPGRIRPPDGSSHDITLAYLGDRKTITTFQVQKVLGGGESAATREVEMDRYGRLRRVREGAGAGGALLPTVYSYDVGSRLTRLFQGSSPQQMRQTDYDNRGFMIRERHPEKGTSGNGWVYFYGYDPLGHPNRVLDEPNDLGFVYDYAGRMTQLFDRAHANRLVTTFAYDTAPGFGLGKLWKAARFNYIDLPWLAGPEETVKVEQILAYQGLGGAVSQKDTAFTWPDGADSFRQNYQYDETGKLSSFTYPRCTTAACTGTTAATASTFTFNYSLGKLVSIPGWINSISYHGDGSWSQIQHSNGVVDHRDRHSQLLSRTGRLWSTGPAQPNPYYDSGLMSYDGAGNIKSMGTDSFAYDSVNRLAAASFPSQGVAQGYQYDPFGNLTQRSTTLDGVTQAENFAIDAATNRLSGGTTYDAAGNTVSQQLNGGATIAFTYDSQNNLTTQAWMRYIYDAFDERAASVVNSPNRNMRFHLRDLGNRLVSEISFDLGTYDRAEDTLFAGGRPVAQLRANGTNFHYHVDHLGTPRLLTTSLGTISRLPFVLPYGEEYPWPDTFDNRKLGGHERDFSTGTDYMHARHYFEKTARFTSADPFRGSPSQPQSLNRYAYVNGNPIRFGDPTGFRPELTYNDWIDVCDTCGVLRFPPGFFRGGGRGTLSGGGPGRAIDPTRPSGGGGGGGGGGEGPGGGGPGEGPGAGGGNGPGDPGISTADVLQGLNNISSLAYWYKAATDLATAKEGFVAALDSFYSSLGAELKFGAWMRTSTLKVGQLVGIGESSLPGAEQALTKSAATLASAEGGLVLARLSLVATFVQIAGTVEIDRSLARSAADLDWNLRNMRGPDDQSMYHNNGQPMTNAEYAAKLAAGRRGGGN